MGHGRFAKFCSVFGQNYFWKVAKQVLTECKSFSKKQFVALLTAVISTCAAVYFKLVPLDQARAAYIAYVAPFVVIFSVYLLYQVVRAPCVLHRKQERAIKKLKNDIVLSNVNVSQADKSLELQERQIAAQEAHTEELRRVRWEKRSEQFIAMAIGPEGPRAIIEGACNGQEASILIKNEGRSADFYVIFSIDGDVIAHRRNDLFGKWAHTDATKIKIAKEQTCRINLATLRFEAPTQTHTWELFASNDDGPVLMRAGASSCACIQPIARAPDIVIMGTVVAEPDLVNGIQPFKVILHAFSAEYL